MEIALLLGFPLVLLAWAGIIMKWRWGVWGLVAYTPFTGVVVTALYPSPLGTLGRDIVVTLPFYISFFLMGRGARYKRIPPLLYCAFGLLALLVLFAMANPAVPNLMVAGIGGKVWLLYIPMLIVGATFVRNEADLRDFLRALIVAAWIPWVVGIIQYLGCTFIGYEKTMRFFFGDYAIHATQGFSSFDSYGAVMYRIAGTFQFNSQYGVFCFFMLFPLLMLLEIERSRRWRTFVWISMMVGLVAGFTSGARGNFVFMPLIFIMVQFFKFRAGGWIQGAIGMGAGLFAALSIAGIDGSKIYGGVADLTSHYGQEIAVGGLLEGLDRGGLFGRGVGANTGAARHGLDASTVQLMHDKGLLIENYYGKALVELGAVGFVVVLICAIVTFICCLQVQFRLKVRSLKGVAACGTAMVAFVMLVSFKGWALDTDPLNYYYYLLLGMMFALPYVERQGLAAAAQRTAATVAASGRFAPVPEGAAPHPDMVPQPASRSGAASALSRRPARRGAPGGIGGEILLGTRLARPAGAGDVPQPPPYGPADEDFDLGPRLSRPARRDTPS